MTMITQHNVQKECLFRLLIIPKQHHNNHHTLYCQTFQVIRLKWDPVSVQTQQIVFPVGYTVSFAYLLTGLTCIFLKKCRLCMMRPDPFFVNSLMSDTNLNRLQYAIEQWVQYKLHGPISNTQQPDRVDGVLPKWSRTFIEFGEFSEFQESDKSLKHELGSMREWTVLYEALLMCLHKKTQ